MEFDEHTADNIPGEVDLTINLKFLLFSYVHSILGSSRFQH